MKNRILGIAVLLAVVALSMAFIVSCGPGEDTSLTFMNKTSLPITVTTNGDRKSITIPKATLQTSPTETETKAGNITLLDFMTGSTTVDSDFFKYIYIDLAHASDVKGSGKGISMGSGTVIFVPITHDEDGSSFYNPANEFSNINAVTIDE